MAPPQFEPLAEFSFDVNRSERSHQVRYLAPLLTQPDGRVWFVKELGCPCSREEARTASVFHLCFPLRDIFTADYYQCRGNAELEAEFIAYYNRLFGLPEEFGVEDVWLTAPNNEIRHPAAGGRAGWYEAFLQERIPDGELCARARDARRRLGTEADVLLLTEGAVVLVECKFKGTPSTEQYERHQIMGEALARFWSGTSERVEQPCASRGLWMKHSSTSGS
jgi:hypothetical protein